MSSPSTTETIPTLGSLITQVRAELLELRERYAVARLSVFGSSARNEQRSGSYLDLLATLSSSGI